MGSNGSSSLPFSSLSIIAKILQVERILLNDFIHGRDSISISVQRVPLFPRQRNTVSKGTKGTGRGEITYILITIPPWSRRLRRERKEGGAWDKERQAGFVKDRRKEDGREMGGGGKNAAVLNLHRLLYARDATKDPVFEFRVVQRGITYFLRPRWKRRIIKSELWMRAFRKANTPCYISHLAI